MKYLVKYKTNKYTESAKTIGFVADNRNEVWLKFKSSIPYGIVLKIKEME